MPYEKQKRRSSFLSVEELPLKKSPIVVWGYDKDKQFVCRLHINAAGITAYGGSKGKKMLCNLTWEGVAERLSDDDE